MTRCLVTGASGLLGLNLCLQFSPTFEVFGVSNTISLSSLPFQTTKKSLEEPEAIENIIDQYKPDIIFHCAAMANIDQCEENPELTFRINAELPGKIAYLSKRKGIKLVHISTDAVFDGQKGNYTEDDQPNPLGVYAKSKLEGENYVSENNPEALIARVNFYGYSITGKRSLSEFFLNNLLDNKSMLGFTDVFFCPLIVNDLVDLLHEMINADLCGIYHTLSCESLSKYAEKRLLSCMYGEIKPVCKHCPVHCYSSVMREQMRQVMRWAGPRMIFRNPVFAIMHLFDNLTAP
ncbi:MAG: nitrous oxide-stimulated promoter family protein, partial [Anaerolineaceae bacterium]|nr:nitrous oxide-stimulated promoter family protein [Anaerolineaceae bacterium]